MRVNGYLACLLFMPLPAACGDSLEDRNAAAGADGYAPRELVIETRTDDADPNPRVIDGSNARADTAARDDGNANGDGGDTVTVHASPEELVIDADGFAPEPMDDARGFAPEPTAPEPFVPEPAIQSSPPGR